MKAQVQTPAPAFTAKAMIGNELRELRLADYRGQYVVLLFYPFDLTLLCLTELLAFTEKLEEFVRRGAQVVAVAVDHQFIHAFFQRVARTDNGAEPDLPIVSDSDRAISGQYGVLLEDGGGALRGLFLIDRQGILRHATMNDLAITRNVDECLRSLDALLAGENREQEASAAPRRPRKSAKIKEAKRRYIQSLFQPKNPTDSDMCN
jgi:alkyl hydroperoxide reductase subunit AhpC